MDNKKTYNKTIISGLLILFIIIGFYIAYNISSANIYVARGILGCVAMYLIFREVDASFNDGSFEIFYDFPRNVKVFAWVLGISTIFSWGLNEALQLIFYVIRSFSSSGGVH